MTLAFSRYQFVWPTFLQTTAAVCEGLDRAWMFFRGIVATLIPDNTKAMINDPGALDPSLVAACLDYVQARALFVDPARVRSPKDKPRVENQALRSRELVHGETFTSLAHARESAEHWCREIAGTRVHGTTRKIVAFLQHLERQRGNAASTRNARLAAIHSFARFVETTSPEHLDLCQRIMAVPFKRARPRLVEYLEAGEVAAILAAPQHTTPDGRRDHALLLTLFNTGARVQELLDLTPADLQLVRPFQVRLRGKGRKERLCPLWPRTAKVLRAFLVDAGVDAGSPGQLFRNHRGDSLTRFGVRYILRKYARVPHRPRPRS